MAVAVPSDKPDGGKMLVFGVEATAGMSGLTGCASSQRCASRIRSERECDYSQLNESRSRVSISMLCSVNRNSLRVGDGQKAEVDMMRMWWWCGGVVW